MDQEVYHKRMRQVFDEHTLSSIAPILEGMPGGLFIYHADGDEELLYINSAVLRIFGCDTEEEFRSLTGYTFKGMVHPEDLDEVEKSIQSQIADSIYDFDYVEYRIIQKDGTVRWIEDYGHFIHTDAYGDIFYVFIDDSTERLKNRMSELEKMNEELRTIYARESQYRKAILYDAISFFEVNLTKDQFLSAYIQMQDGQLKDFFEYSGIPRFEKYTDYVRFWMKDMDSAASEEYVKFIDADRLIRCYDKGELEQTYDGWMTDVMGRRHLYHYAFLLGRNEYTGDVITMAITKDMTEQVQRQNLLKSALSQAQTANIARNTFLQNMSHDIRTPLNAIIGYAELARKHKTETDRVDNYLDQIRLASEQLLAIVNESLEVTRMESGKVHLVENIVMLGDLLAELERSMRSQVEVKTLCLTIDRSQVRHGVVYMDFLRMKELLFQLLDNAVKYTEPHGRVTLTVIEEDVQLEHYGKFRFVVEDNGRGISQKFRRDLFLPFKRERNTTKSGVLGTGLGLSVVKSLVDLMEGNIVVESEEGKGSKFTVDFLLKLPDEPPRQDQPQPLQEEIDLKGKRILLVEDNEINREIAQELLADEGYIVETANDGSIALEMVKNSKPHYFDLILMDIQMPVMDGHKATKAIRALEDRELAEIPIIALSANAFAEDCKRSIEAGMDAHVPKPIKIEELQDTIRNVLARFRRE
ncbi:MAG: response regulator [Lachnospiraceae bacterium]|nr:response regulator [Lachnospiraceae bacterium]MDE7200968.1 response regulator [Lachnospiraceae bacterium]